MINSSDIIGGSLTFANVAIWYPAFSILGNIGIGKNWHKLAKIVKIWQKLKYLHKLLLIISLFQFKATLSKIVKKNWQKLRYLHKLL